MAFSGGSLSSEIDKIIQESLESLTPLLDSISLDATVSRPLTNTGDTGSRVIDGVPFSTATVAPASTTTATAANLNGDSSGSPVKFSLVRVDGSVVWEFICPPNSVKWGKTGETSTVSAYGTNTPVVVYSSTSMRQLSVSEVIVEGYTFKSQILSKLKDLERMMDMVTESSEGFVSPYIWNFRASGTSYGLYLITSLEVEELIRNEKGEATRAVISLQLQEVGAFQVNTGRDLASKGDLAVPDKEFLESQAEALSDKEKKDKDGEDGKDGKDGDTGESTEDTNSSEVRYSFGAGGDVLAEKGDTRALCQTNSEGACIALTAKDNLNFEKLGISPGRKLKDGVFYRPRVVGRDGQGRR